MMTHRRPTTLRSLALMFALLAGLSLVLGAVLSDARAQTAPQYTFTKVVDSVEDGFDPFNFGCAAINTRGDIAFRAGRLAPDGFNTIDGIYRANADGTLTTIAEDQKRFDFIGSNPSINDSGQVSFAAALDAQDKQTDENIQVILRSDGKKLTTIATTADRFRSFGFDTSINNSGEVAFAAELDEELSSDEGLFSGSGGKRGITTHYLTSTDVSLDGQPVRFAGSDSRPSINNVGDIAFAESIQPGFDSGIFVGREGTFRTVAAPDPDVFVEKPVINDTGSVAFYRTVTEEGTQVFELVTIDADGTSTVVADSRGKFASFGFRPPSLNNNGDVAFFAELDSGGSGIFVGPDPDADRVIATGDTLDGKMVQNITFCEEGLNDSGQLAFVATLVDPISPEGFRTAVFRATPAP
jgi:hypothetical protein